VRDLVGAIGRDARAQTAIGVTLGAYVNSLADGLGVDIARRSGVEHVAQFADLVGDAVTAEQAEMVAAAAAASAQRRVLAGAVGFGVSAAASAAGGGPIVNFAVGQLVGIGADRFAHVDPDTVEAGTVVKGAEMVEKKLLKSLGTAGLEIVDPVNQTFDPTLHEAVATEPALSSEDDHVVARVYQVGYLFNGQLLRPARVVVKQWNG